MTPILQQDCRQHAGRLSRFQPHSGLTPTCTLARHKWEEVPIELVYPDLGTPSSRRLASAQFWPQGRGVGGRIRGQQALHDQEE